MLHDLGIFLTDAPGIQCFGSQPYIGKEYKEGDAFCYIQAPWGEFETIPAALGGKLVEINAKQGSKVRKGDVIAYIEREAE